MEVDEGHGAGAKDVIVVIDAEHPTEPSEKVETEKKRGASSTSTRDDSQPTQAAAVTATSSATATATANASAAKKLKTNAATPQSVSRLKPVQKVPAGGAYAKLDGKYLDTDERFEAFVTQLPMTLGRKHARMPSDFISLGSSKHMSKIHAVLDYDFKAECFTIEIKGKNGAVVCGRYYGAAEDKVKLGAKDPIKVGTLGIYFCPVSVEKPKLSYAELALSVFQDLGQDGIPLGTKEITTVLEHKHKYFENQRGSHTTSLNASLQQAIRRSDQFLRAAYIKNSIAHEKGRLGFLLTTDSSQMGIDARKALDTGTMPSKVVLEDDIQTKIKSHFNF
mmetsp:Transcript_18940/g.35068  ORF Transcript_18940/g.35068 Transcript_18940/m.35068 type:complete len:335 (-) Transcript_18940:1294-2298(-)